MFVNSVASEQNIVVSIVITQRIHSVARRGNDTYSRLRPRHCAHTRRTARRTLPAARLLLHCEGTGVREERG